jgi:uncharacterized protein (DUF433 family)
MNEPQNGYRYLAPREGSVYREWFVKGRKIRASFLWSDTLEPDAMTPQEVADNYDVPVEAVREAIDFCEKNQDLLEQDWKDEWDFIRAHGLDKPPHVPATST